MSSLPLELGGGRWYEPLGSGLLNDPWWEPWCLVLDREASPGVHGAVLLRSGRRLLWCWCGCCCSGCWSCGGGDVAWGKPGGGGGWFMPTVLVSTVSVQSVAVCCCMLSAAAADLIAVCRTGFPIKTEKSCSQRER